MLTFKLVISKMQHFKKIMKFDAQIMIRREKKNNNKKKILEAYRNFNYDHH
jgi:hypothetical protein